MITARPTEVLSEYAANVRYEDLPPEVIEKAKDGILDTLGCVLEGTKGDGYAPLRDSLWQLGRGEVPVWGTGDRASLQNAVLLHAAMSHSTEYDDSHKRSKTHPGSVILPAALGAAMLGQKVDGKGLLAAVVAGYELALRVGIALGAGEHRIQGWHATATCGIFGAAAAAGSILLQGKDSMASTLGSAGTQAAGIWAFTSDGAMSKQLHAGKSAQGGLLAAVLSQNGFTGSHYILEAEDGGFFSTFAPGRREEWKSVILDRLGERYEILDIAFKPYPCCRTVHCAIDAALNLQSRHDVPVEDIRGATVRTYDVAIRQCGFSNPSNSRQAMFSFPYVMAVALKNKRPIVSSDFSEASLHDTQLMSLHDRIGVELSEELDALFPRLWPCEVIVETKAGEVYSERVDVARGDPKASMSREDLRDKFFGCAEDVIPRSQAEDIVSLIDSLEDLGDVSELWNSCVKA